MTQECAARGGFWVSYSIHDQEWVPCERCAERFDCKGQTAPRVWINPTACAQSRAKGAK